MNLGKPILQSMIAYFYQYGVKIDKIDFDNHILYISLPKESYGYHQGGKIINAESHAKRIKEVFIEMKIFPENCKVKYREMNICWTKEMGNRNLKLHKEDVINLKF